MLQEVALREEWSWEATFESCSKQFCLQNLYFKATQFRRTCGYQNMKSPKIYTNLHLFNFSEECRFNTLSSLANVLTATKSPYIFCSYKSERTKTKHCCKKWTVVKCIFQWGNSQVVNCTVTEMAFKSETSPRHQESRFLCLS